MGEAQEPPSPLSTYPRVLVGAVRSALPGSAPPARLPDRGLTAAAVRVERRHVERYARLCTFALSDGLPVTYPHLLGFTLSLRLMAAADFPFPVLGLVHVANRIERTRPIGIEETLRVGVHAADLRDHPRGSQFDIVCAVTAGGDEVWRETSTYLHRQSSPKRARPPGARDARPDPPRPQLTFAASGDIGRRYGAVSGDRNPIHLAGLPAKAFGMPRAIAHGMWLKARTLAILERHVPAAGTVDAEFKLPVLLPARVGLASWTDGGLLRIAVTDADGERPHMFASISEADRVGGSAPS